MIAISALRELVTYNPETGLLHWVPRSNGDPRFNGKPAFCTVKNTGHLCGRLDGKGYAAHRIAWALYYGTWPEHIDHINGNPADNRIVNLRSVSASINCRNKRLQSNSPTKHFGVRREGRKWTARIKVAGQEKRLGAFQTYEEAVAARKLAELQHEFGPNHGRHSVSNGAY